jgi:hypothetical protein
MYECRGNERHFVDDDFITTSQKKTRVRGKISFSCSVSKFHSHFFLFCCGFASVVYSKSKERTKESI